MNTTPEAMREAAALLPCPFCGHEPYDDEDTAIAQGHGGHTIACSWCEATAGNSGSFSDAISAWNRRALPIAPQPVAMVQPDPVANAALAFVDAFDRRNPMRTADMHPADCQCIRCAVDLLRALAALPNGGDGK